MRDSSRTRGSRTLFLLKCTLKNIIVDKQSLRVMFEMRDYCYLVKTTHGPSDRHHKSHDSPHGDGKGLGRRGKDRVPVPGVVVGLGTGVPTHCLLSFGSLLVPRGSPSGPGVTRYRVRYPSHRRTRVGGPI